MSHLHNAGIPHNDGRSKAFLLGLYVGLSLLLLVSHLDPDRNSPLGKATNIYGLQALAGAALGYRRIRKRRADPTTTPALASVLICGGLTLWAIGQGVWTLGTAILKRDPYPWYSDIFYMGSNLCWLVALFYVFKSLRRRVLPAVSSYTAIVSAVLALFLTLFGWVNSYLIDRAKEVAVLNQQTPPDPLLTLVCDLVYVFLAFSSMLLAVALVVGDNAETPSPVHQCIRYLCFATAIDAGAILAFTVTTKFAEKNPWAYFNGNWVDWLFLTAIYCWGVSALKCPIREEELRYTFGTKLTKEVRAADVYRAGEIARQCCANEGEAARVAAYTSSIRWILDNTPECWRVVKLGDWVVGSTLLFPVPQRLIDSLVARKTTEREMFEEVKRNPLKWDYLYLADASILGGHRRRGLAFKCFVETIELKKSQNPEIKVCCRPNSIEEKGLTKKLEKHFGIQIVKVEGDDESDDSKPE